MSATKPPRLCRLCRQPGHRADKCPNGPRLAVDKTVRGRAPAPDSPQKLVAVLVKAAETLGETKAMGAVEDATREVLQQVRALRLALIRSRAANARLRAQVEDEKVAADLAKLDATEGGRG